MVTCLLSLGSNVGDREAMLRAAVQKIDDVRETRLVRASGWHRTRAVGGPLGQGEYLNAAAVVESDLPRLEFVQALQHIESEHGRQRSERWAARSLDIDLLFVDDQVIESAELTVPHPRMSFRRFVLAPAAEVAGDMLHPTIGWTIQQLLDHLNAAGNCLAVLSPSENARRALAATLAEQFRGRVIDVSPPPAIERSWPASWTTWVCFENQPASDATEPKLSILLDSPAADWSAVAAQSGRGPTLRLPAADEAIVRAEAFAAVESVWPRLGPTGGLGLQ